MTTQDITDYIANECGSYPYFERYANNRGTAIIVADEDGNEFKVSVAKVAKKSVKKVSKKGGAR